MGRASHAPMEGQEHGRGHGHADHRRTPAKMSAPRDRMPARKRLAIYLVLGSLWLSGCVWLALDEFFESRGQFGMTPHPWAPAILLVHGIVAILSMYLLGWVTARHVLRWWPGRLRRLSGGVLAVFFVFLSLSGFALFFVSDDRWQHLAATAHDALGLGITVFAIQHWFFARRRDMRRAASRPW
jgi:uncharacterized membrane protein